MANSVPVMISRVPGGGGADGSDDVPAVRVLFVYPTYRNMLSPATLDPNERYLQLRRVCRLCHPLAGKTRLAI
ncbi:MAG: hypothetical protein QF637_02905, partial [Acidimicrobiales bacterium]|nr:hypothetical protein [Acidimicrobiales bacterium]